MFTSEIDFLRHWNQLKPTDMPPHLISEYIMKKDRILPPGSPRSGIMDLHTTPYVIEMMDAAGPYSGINRITVLKGVQIALSTMLENIIAYYMDANPAEIMYCTATEGMIRKWLKRLEAMIDSCDIRDKISSQTEKTKSKSGKSKSGKSGDTDFSKEYPGGSLSMVSLNSPSNMRSESNRILAIDEVDAARKEVTTGEGNFLGLLDGRTAAYSDASWRVISTSTPKTLEASVIYPEYKAGDQRKYFVPCLMCGDYFVYDFKYFRPIFDKHGYLSKVFHECPSCNKEIWNYNKKEMMRIDHAEWRPTAIPQDKAHRSYHISGLYSPFASWERVYKAFLKAEEDITLKPSFRNLWEGMPYKEDGYRPDIKKVIGLRGDYKNGIVPHGVIYLTMAGDVQLGLEKYQRMSPEELQTEIDRIRTTEGELVLWKSKIPRIELEVYGVGKDYRSWSVDYKVFYGHTTLGAFEGAFEEVVKWFEETKLIYMRDDGVKFNPKIASFDASEGKTRSTVFELCERLGSNVYPNVNFGWLKMKQDKALDEETNRSVDRWREAKKTKYSMGYLEISTNYYKQQVYSRLNKQRDNIGMNPPGFCEFPRDRADHYFHMLTAEEMIQSGDKKGSFYNGGKPAESLDCRVYNLCIADVWLEAQVKKARENAEKSKRYAPEEIKKIDKKYILAGLEAGLCV